ARARRYSRRRPDHGGDPGPGDRAGSEELRLRRPRGEKAQDRQAHQGGLHRPHHPGPVRLRLRHGCEGALAQSPGDSRHEGHLMLAVIGGSGLTQFEGLAHVRRKTVHTPYGDSSAALSFGRIGNEEIVFLARHGDGHSIAPHEVNYRANIWALKEAGAKQVVAIAPVGGIHKDMGPGTLAVPDKSIDYTWGRPSTYSQGPGVPVRHIDFTEPYSGLLRQRILDAALACGESIAARGVYAATQ